MKDYNKIKVKLQNFLYQFEEICNEYKSIEDWRNLCDELKENLGLVGFYSSNKTDRKNRLIKAIGILDEAIKSKTKIKIKDENSIKNEIKKMSTLFGYLGSEKFNSSVFGSNLEEIYCKKKWLMYCFHISNVGRQVNRPEICRAVLSIDENGVANLENLSTKDDYNSINYRGKVKKIDNDKTLVFNLYNVDIAGGLERNLNIKTSFQSINDEIQLGIYNTFDSELKYHGSVILQQVNYEGIYEAKLLSYWKNKEEFMKLDPRVIEYLSLKSRNYYLSPTKKPSLDSLYSLFKNQSPFKQVEQRFIELQKPRIFIAAQQSSINMDVDSNTEGENFVNYLHKGLKQSFSKTHEITFHSKEIKTQVDILNYLMRTRFFILFVSDESKLSLSSLQFGWAIAFCKKIILIHRRRSISKRLESFIAEGKIEGVQKVMTIETIIYDDIEKEKSHILPEIEDYIKKGTR